jgi:CHAT domain-containing protein
MRMYLAIGWFAALALLRVDAVVAAPPSDAAAFEAIYFDLGRGDGVDAEQRSAQVLATTSADSPRRIDALQARLDVLAQQVKLNTPDGAALGAAIDAIADADPAARELAARFAIAQAYDRSDVRAARTLAQARIAVAKANEKPELQVLLARIEAYGGHLVSARQHAQLALVVWQPRAGMRARWLETELDYIVGKVYEITGSAEAALPPLQSGAQVAATAFGEDSALRIKLDTERAAVLGKLGRNRDALQLREVLLGVAQRHFGQRSLQAAKAEAQVAASFEEIGDYASSRLRFEHAQQLLTDAPAHERAVLAANFANLLQDMGEEQAALDQHRLALLLLGESDQTAPVRAIVLGNLGNTELRLHRYTDAVVDLQRSLQLREKIDGKDSPELAYVLEGLGGASLALGLDAQAESYFRRALALQNRTLAPNHPTIAPLRFGLALARWGQGDEAEAFRLAVQTAEHQQALLATFAADFAQRQSVAYRDVLMPATALAVTLAARRRDVQSIATAWHLEMVERGLVARAQAHRLAAARATDDPAVAKALDAWRQANAALGAAWLDKKSDFARMARLTAAEETAERALWRSTGQHAVPAARAVADLADLARALPVDGLLIAYSDGLGADRNRVSAMLDKSPASDWYAFTLHHDGQPQLRIVGAADALSAQVRAFYLDLRNPASSLAKLRRDGEDVRHAVLDPLLADRKTAHLFVVPEGELYRLSFAALPNAEHGYLIDSGVNVHTLAQESDLTMTAAVRAAPTILLAGATDFGTRKSVAAGASRQLCLRAAHEGFAPIPQAGRELEELNALFSGVSARTKIELLRGAAATTKNVLASLPQANIAHLATHGFSLDETCANPGSRGVTLDRAQPRNAAAVQESTLSGLAFSGASIAPGSPALGVLSAGELGTLDLSHMDWIALSACDSGLGPIGRNEGVFGMRRALRMAGARTVVMSLWQVDDAATADLMQNLYRARFVEHADVPDAMATAMRAVIAARRAKGESDHPYYWAAFISEGGWR